MRPLNLHATQYFEAVARLGGVTKAAQELHVSPSAVSQQIRLLEQQLGVKLFTRSKQVLALTIDGDRLYQAATRTLQSFRDVQGAILRQRENLGLSVRVSPSFGEKWLAPRLVDFCRQHPDLNVRVDGTPNFTDFANEVVDVDIRYGDGHWEHLHSQHLIDDLVLPMCSPDYRDELSKVSDDPIVQLGQARLVDSVKTLLRWDQWLELNSAEGVAMTYPYRLERSSMAIEVGCRSGGLILESVTLAHDKLVRGELVPFSPTFPAVVVPAYWIVCPSRHLSRRTVRDFIDWLLGEGDRLTRDAGSLLTGMGMTTRPK
jgi:LysR family glycine cleavage system transcriptional activator